MFKRLLIYCIILLPFVTKAQESIKVMFYNILMFPEEQVSFDRANVLREIMDEYEADILMVCELQSEEGANQILDISLNDEGLLYAAAPFIDNQSSSADLQQLVFYRRDKFTLESADIIETEVRDINKYVLKLNTANGDVEPILFNLYVTHLKSSQGGANINLRLDMVTEFTNTLSDLDPNSNVIFAGDLNLYTSTEPAYIELLDYTNLITLVDPINTPGAWNNNSNFQTVHTQSTRTSSGPFGTGAGGGMDDRFDFILMSENMLTNPSLKYVSNTYKAYGNNGNCFNLSVNNSDCMGEFSSELRENLWIMSDHLPVVMEFETDQEVVILSGTDFDEEEPRILIKNTLINNILELKTTTPLKKTLEVEVYNTLGMKLMSTTFSSEKILSINVSTLASGLYYVNTSLNTDQPLKFIKK